LAGLLDIVTEDFVLFRNLWRQTPDSSPA
jgi:hypothetical protein